MALERQTRVQRGRRAKTVEASERGAHEIRAGAAARAGQRPTEGAVDPRVSPRFVLVILFTTHKHGIPQNYGLISLLMGSLRVQVYTFWEARYETQSESPLFRIGIGHDLDLGRMQLENWLGILSSPDFPAGKAENGTESLRRALGGSDS